MAGRSGFAFSRTLVSWTRDNVSVKALVQGYFLHSQKEFFVSAVSDFSDNAEFSRVVDVAGSGKFFNFPDSRLTIDLDKLQIGQFDSRVRKSVEKGSAFKPTTIARDSKSKTVLLAQVPSFELRESSKTVAGWNIVAETPQQRRERKQRNAKPNAKERSSSSASKDVQADKNAKRNETRQEKESPKNVDNTPISVDSVADSMDSLTARLTELRGDLTAPRKNEVPGWAEEMAGKIDIDRLETAKGNLKDFLKNGRKRLAKCEISKWDFQKEDLSFGDEIDIVIDFSTADLLGYLGGQAPVSCPGYMIDDKSFVFVQPST